MLYPAELRARAFRSLEFVVRAKKLARQGHSVVAPLFTSEHPRDLALAILALHRMYVNERTVVTTPFGYNQMAAAPSGNLRHVSDTNYLKARAQSKEFLGNQVAQIG